MTRNEWIAETAARLAATRTSDPDTLIVRCALDLAECLELKGYAPWLDSAPPAPALTDTAAKVVESAEFAFNNDDEDEEAACKARVRLWDAVRAHLAAKQGGAK